MARTYFVSRQHYWPDGRRVVEVAIGGRASANPDMIAPRYPGEAEDYTDPREAVEAAISIARAWRSETSDRTIRVAIGATGGMTMPLEGTTFSGARAWAAAEYERRPKCDRCGDVLGRQSYTLGDRDEPCAGRPSVPRLRMNGSPGAAPNPRPKLDGGTA